MWRHHYDDSTVTVCQLYEAIAERMEGMATQADIDAIAAALDQVATDLRTAVEAVQAELNDIIAKSPPLDLTALTAKVQSLDAQAKQVGGLVPAAA